MKNHKISLTEATMLALQGKLNLDESVDVSIQDDGLTVVDTDDKIITVQNKDTLPEETILPEEVSEEVVEELPEDGEEEPEDETCEDCEDSIEVPIEGDETIIPEQEVSEEVVEDILDESKEVKTESKLEESGVDTALEALNSYIEDGSDKLDEEWLCNDIELNLRNTESLMKAITTTKRPPHSIAYDGLIYTLNNRVEGAVNSYQVKAAFKKLGLDFKEVLKPVIAGVEEIRNEDKQEEVEDLDESKEVKTEDYTPDTRDKIIAACENDLLDWETVARECIIGMSDDDAKEMVRINKWILDGDDLEESKQCDEEDCEHCKEKKEEKLKFSSKTFNEALTRFYKSQYGVVESFKLTKLLHSNNTLKLEGKLSNNDGLQKDVTLNLMKVQEGKSFVKYVLKPEGKSLVKESKSNLNMMTSINDGVLKCKYLITK